jgi:hypothetical protein
MARYEPNRAAVEKARELIAARQYVLVSEWDDAQPTAADENAFLDRHSGTIHGAARGSPTAGATTDEGQVCLRLRRLAIHRSGLIACVFRASQWRHKKVELAAHDLLQELDAKAGIGAD